MPEHSHITHGDHRLTGWCCSVFLHRYTVCTSVARVSRAEWVPCTRHLYVEGRASTSQCNACCSVSTDLFAVYVVSKCALIFCIISVTVFVLTASHSRVIHITEIASSINIHTCMAGCCILLLTTLSCLLATGKIQYWTRVFGGAMCTMCAWVPLG